MFTMHVLLCYLLTCNRLSVEGARLPWVSLSANQVWPINSNLVMLWSSGPVVGATEVLMLLTMHKVEGVGEREEGRERELE